MDRNLLEGDPARERYEQLVAALGHPTLGAYESATVARLVSWTTAAEVGTLARLIRQGRGGAPIEGGTMTENQRLIVELGVIIGKTRWDPDKETTITVPSLLGEQVVHAALEIAPSRFPVGEEK